MNIKLVRDTTGTDEDGVTHSLFWGQTVGSPWCYHKLCNGNAMFHIIANSDEEGPPTCVWCVVSTRQT